MTDHAIGPTAEDRGTADRTAAAADDVIATEDLAAATDGPASDREQHASADVAPELFGW
jgi:hypothetical protein